MIEWRDISTAPKDRRWIEALVGDRILAVRWWFVGWIGHDLEYYGEPRNEAPTGWRPAINDWRNMKTNPPAKFTHPRILLLANGITQRDCRMEDDVWVREKEVISGVTHWKIDMWWKNRPKGE